MNPEQKVVSQPLAKRMQELGWKHETDRYWYRELCKDWHVVTGMVQGIRLRGENIPAPDLSEILEVLPWKIEFRPESSTIVYRKHQLCLFKGEHQSRAAYEHCDDSIERWDANPAEAAGLLWCWCVEKGYVKP